jgi:hypothetical protein
MLKRYLPIFWLVGLYLITALTEGLDPAPELWWQRVLFESRHVLVHSIAFAVGGILIRYAFDRDDATLRPADFRGMLVIMLLVGVGQESIQTIMRQRIAWIGSPADLAVDVVGGFIGLRLYPRVKSKLDHVLVRSRGKTRPPHQHLDSAQTGVPEE